MLVRERYKCTSHEVIGLLGRCPSLWLSFMALPGPLDPKTRRGIPLEVHEEVLEMVANLARRHTQEEALKNGLRDQWTQKIYQISKGFRHDSRVYVQQASSSTLVSPPFLQMFFMMFFHATDNLAGCY